MTSLESMMLSVCFGAVVGWILGNVAFLIHEAVCSFREKRRKRLDKDNGSVETAEKNNCESKEGGV